MQAVSEFASSSAFDSQVPWIALWLDLQTLQEPLASRQRCKRQTGHFSLKQSCKPTILHWLDGTLMNGHIFLGLILLNFTKTQAFSVMLRHLHRCNPYLPTSSPVLLNSLLVLVPQKVVLTCVLKPKCEAKSSSWITFVFYGNKRVKCSWCIRGLAYFFFFQIKNAFNRQSRTCHSN